MKYFLISIFLLFLVGCGVDHYPPADSGRTLQFRHQDESVVATFNNVVRYSVLDSNYKVYFVKPDGSIDVLTVEYWRISDGDVAWETGK